MNGQDDTTLTRISDQNAAHYLNAAKHLGLSGKSWPRTTFAVRLTCARKSNGSINTIQAFSYRNDPEAFTETNPDGSVKVGKKFAIYRMAQEELVFVPEWRAIQTKIYEQTCRALLKISRELQGQNRQLILFTGTYGAGKSHQTQRHPWVPSRISKQDLGDGILSTDNIKKLYLKDVSGLRNTQCHYDGGCLRWSIMETCITHQSDLSMIQEACFGSEGAIQTQLDLAKKGKMDLRVVDLDTNLRTSCLRILTRNPLMGDAIPPFQVIATMQKLTRKTRPYVLKLAQDDDSIKDFQLIFSDRQGSHLLAEKTQRGYRTFPEESPLLERALRPSSDEEIKEVANYVIKESDSSEYGNRLGNYVGMNLDAALSLANSLGG